MNSNDASFGNVHFRSVYENQNDQFNTGNKVQQKDGTSGNYVAISKK